MSATSTTETKGASAAASAPVSQPPASPLQLSQRAYPVSEAVILAPSAGAKADDPARLTRITFSSGGQGFVPALGDSVVLEASDAYAELKAVDDVTSGRQVLFGLRSDGLTLDRVEEQDGGSLAKTVVTVTPLTGAAPPSQCVVGILPTPLGNTNPTPSQIIGAGPLLLAGCSSSKLVLTAVDPQSGHVQGTWSWTLTGTPAVLDAMLLRAERDANVLFVLKEVDTNTISVACIPAAGLAGTTPPLQTLDLGTCVDGATVTAVAGLLDGNSRQELLAVAVPQATGVDLYVISADDVVNARTPVGNTLSKISTLKPFQAADRPVFRLAAADLDDDGDDELIVGWSATYKDAPGSVFLSLLALDAASHADPETHADPPIHALIEQSNYVAKSLDRHPAASIDLWLEAGVFSSDPDLKALTTGVLVLACGASLGDLGRGQSELFAQVVSVDKTSKTFPLAASVPFTTLTTAAAAKSVRLFGLAADLSGLSITLGQPTFSEVKGESQILAIIALPPYEHSQVGAGGEMPQVTFTQDENGSQGCDLTSSKMWMTSKDTGGSGGIDSVATVSRHLNKTHGKSFDKNTDSTVTTAVTTSMSVQDQDLILVNAMDYWVWTYPVRRATGDLPDKPGPLIVVFPASASPLQIGVLGDLIGCGYAPKYENGSVLSYVGIPPDGLEAGGDLFTLDMKPVGKGTGATWTYDKSSMKHDMTQKSYTVHNTVTTTAHFTAAFDLFEFLPLTFGFNLGLTETYSDTEMTSTTLSFTTSMSVTITLGSIGDDGWSYSVTPHLYPHATLGCLMLAYEVDPTGALWRSPTKSMPEAKLIRLDRWTTADTLLSAYTRSIYFTEDKEGVVWINVDVFNCAYGDANDGANWKCTAYEGWPDPATLAPPNDASAKIGGTTISKIAAQDRQTVTIQWPNATDNTVVCVQITSDDILNPEIGWNLYPTTADGLTNLQIP
jgi:hypothetical protein